MLKISSHTTVYVRLEEVISPALLLYEKTYVHRLGSDIKEIKGILQEIKKQANRYGHKLYQNLNQALPLFLLVVCLVFVLISKS